MKKVKEHWYNSLGEKLSSISWEYMGLGGGWQELSKSFNAIGHYTTFQRSPLVGTI